jgi:VHL beta domain
MGAVGTSGHIGLWVVFALVRGPQCAVVERPDWMIRGSRTLVGGMAGTMAPGDARTRKLRQRGSSRTAAETSARSKERREQIQHIAALVGAIVDVLGLLMAVIAYILPRSAPSSTPERIPSSSAGQSAVVVSTDLQPRACSEAGALKSTADDTKSVIQFVNRRSEAVRLYWINYDGVREGYGNLPPGETLEFDTYETHAWLIADASDRCIAVFAAAKKPGRAVIQ